MKAALFETYRKKGPIRIGDIAKPIPKPNELLIQVKATTVTAVDSIFRRGESLFPRLATGLYKPKIQVLGTEFSGVVEEVGIDVIGFKPGDEVIADSTTHYGSHAEYVCITDQDPVIHKPGNLTWQEAAALCYGGLTSLPFLRDAGEISNDKSILIIGASGSVGSCAVQIAHHFGAEVTGMCSTANMDIVMSLGADHVIDYRKTRLHEIDQSFDIVFDSVGKYSLKACRHLLSQEGRYLTTVIGFGALGDGLRTRIAGRQKSILLLTGLRSPEDRKKDLQFLKTLVESGELKPLIDRTYNLDQVNEAFDYVDQGHKKGNVILNINAA